MISPHDRAVLVVTRMHEVGCAARIERLSEGEAVLWGYNGTAMPERVYLDSLELRQEIIDLIRPATAN